MKQISKNQIICTGPSNEQKINDSREIRKTIRVRDIQNN